MSRRVTAAVGAAALLAVVLPAVPAFAAAASTATLDAGDVEVLPGAVNTFDVVVRNNEVNQPILGGGRTINAVRVLLPQESLLTVDPSTFTIPGWKVVRTSSTTTGLERYDLEATGAGIAPGGSFSFALPATVKRPFSGDRAAALQIGASSNKGDTYQSATGSLTTTVRTLKVTAINLLNRPGQAVADGNGTARQEVDTTVTVQNLAGGAQTVTAKLESIGGSNPDSATTPAAASVATGAVASFPVTLTLGAVTADTLRTLRATATSAKSSATTPFLRSEIPYTVQVAPRLTLASASFAPTSVNGRTSYTFSVDGTKTGTPALSIQKLGGSLVLRNRADGALSQTIPLKDAVSFSGGTGSQKFTFTETQLDGVNLKDGRYDALFAFAGVDGNGYTLPADDLKSTLADILNLDNIGPVVSAVITLPTDRDGDRTTAARNYVAADNNAITVSGTSNDASSTLAGVTLQCTVGETLVLTPATTPTTTVSGANINYSARFEPKFGACRTFTAVASFEDKAGNVGEATNVAIISIDNQVPNLDTKTGGVTGSVARYDGVDATKSSIMVDIADNTATTNGAPTGVIGGCDPRAYSVDGQLLVQGVYVLENGGFRECTTGIANARAAAKPANNARYLRLSSDVSRSSTAPEPVVTYDPARSGVIADRLKDAAGNYALAGVQDTINRLVPAAPVLVDVTRNAAKEKAYNDGTAYYTRISGSDLMVTVNGALKGDSIQLLKNGVAIGGRTSTLDGGGTIAVPVDAVEGTTQNYSVRFVSGRGIDGELTAFKVVFDKTLPGGLSTAKAADGTARVTFTEPVLGGNQAINWNVWETVENEFGQPARGFRGVNGVTGTGAVRNISADFTTAPYGGALYEFLSGTLYEDFAGNLLATSTEVVAR